MVGKRAPSTRSSHVGKIGGPPAELDETEPPIYRLIIQYSYFLFSTYPESTDYQIAKRIAKAVINIWKMVVNPRLPLIGEQSVIVKLLRLVKSSKDVNRDHRLISKKTFLQGKLDRLFDISACKCELPLVSCDDNRVKCKRENCQTKHIICSCPPIIKVPVEEREYLKDQRTKIGPKGSFQLGPIDRDALKRSRREFQRLRFDSIASTSTDQDDIFPQHQSSSTSATTSASEENEEEYSQPSGILKGVYCRLPLHRYAMELVRGDVSSRLGANLANALFKDLEAAGYLTPKDVEDIILDKSKVDRAKEKTKDQIHQIHERKMENLLCIGVDGKHDKETLFYQEIVNEDGEVRLKPAKGPERHLIFTKESGRESEYLTHRTLPETGATGAVQAEEVFSVLTEYNSVDSVKAVLVDNTSTNTGQKSGLVTILERMIGRHLHTIGCSLHQNELPFRAIFKNCDGQTKSPSSFNGPLGKLCANNYHNMPQIEFPKIGSPLLSMVDKDTLNSDQRLLYEYTVGIASGEVDPQYASWKIGPLHQARWLTLAIRLMCLWTRGAYPKEQAATLRKLVKFIVEVYATSWFEIKTDNKFHNQQLYIFNMIQRIKNQESDIQEIAFKNIQHNAFALLPENVLFAMMKSDELEVREQAVRRILAIRRQERPKERMKKIPEINFGAVHWSDLISLSNNGICQPAMIENFTDNELHESSMSGTKLVLPDLPSHSQGVERAVKMTSDASKVVYGPKARHKHIVTKIMSQKLRGPFSSKGFYTEQFDCIFEEN